MSEPERPEGAIFWTCDDVVRWIGQEVVLDPDETPEQAALWWKACEIAGLLHDLTLKETAREVLDGIGPVTPEMITEDVQAQHGNVDVTNGGSHAACDEDIEEDLRLFFNINKRD